MLAYLSNFGFIDVVIPFRVCSNNWLCDISLSDMNIFYELSALFTWNFNITLLQKFTVLQQQSYISTNLKLNKKYLILIKYQSI